MENKVRILCTGVCGQLGHDVVNELIGSNFEPLNDWKDAVSRYLKEAEL